MNMIELLHGESGQRPVSAGQTIFSEGDGGDVMYVILEGEADIFVGHELVETAGAESVLGEMALIDNQPRSATVVARTDCRLLPIDGGKFDALTRRTPDFARIIMKVMAERVRNMNRRNMALLEHAIKF